jgi:hypothetical protein
MTRAPAAGACLCALAARAAVVCLCVLVPASLGACVSPPPLAPASPETYSTEQAHLLLFPQADAESLLGRAVQKFPDGSWTIADARAPGCQVSVTRQSARFHSSRTVQAHTMTSLAGGYAKVVSVQVKFGRENVGEIDVDNSQILRADMRGACGELVVDTVFVGHGKRRIGASSVAAGKADIITGVTHAAPAVDTGQSQEDAIEWSDDEAYGFSTRENAKSEPLQMRVSIPSVVQEGDDVQVRFESDAAAWLVVYYLDGKGHADVLWPSNEEPAPRVSPEEPAILPSAHERSQGFRIQAGLLQRGRPSRETLVVYGFADRRDFEAMKPGAGSESADGAAYAAALTTQLQNIPMSRWSREVVGYVIEPRPAAHSK